jgi:hypothetical protein
MQSGSKTQSVLFLNPCLWADKPVTVDLAAGGAVSGVSVVASKGVIVTMGVQNSQGLLAANPANDDVRIGAYRGKSPFIPVYVSGRDATGKTMNLAVPRSQPVNIALSSATFTLADSTGKAFGADETQILVPSTALVAAASARHSAVVTGQVRGRSERSHDEGDWNLGRVPRRGERKSRRYDTPIFGRTTTLS